MGQPGFIYAMSNPSLPGQIKIGLTQNHPKQRAKELSGTSVATPFEIIHFVYVSDCYAAETYAHQKFEDQRINLRREFFAITEAEAIGMLKELEIKFRYIPPAVIENTEPILQKSSTLFERKIQKQTLSNGYRRFFPPAFRKQSVSEANENISWPWVIQFVLLGIWFSNRFSNFWATMFCIAAIGIIVAVKKFHSIAASAILLFWPLFFYPENVPLLTLAPSIVGLLTHPDLLGWKKSILFLTGGILIALALFQYTQNPIGLSLIQTPSLNKAIPAPATDIQQNQQRPLISSVPTNTPVAQQNQIVSKESVKINSINLEHNFRKEGILGLKIKISISTNNLSGKTLNLHILFTDANKTAVLNPKSKYANSNGEIALAQLIKVDTNNQTYKDLEFFIPYKDIYAGAGQAAFYAYALVTGEDLSEMVTKSEYKYFTITN